MQSITENNLSSVTRTPPTITSVPFISLKRWESGLKEGVLRDIHHLIENTEFVGGPSIARLEQLLTDYTGIAAVACANGTDAIQIALRTLGVGPGDSVLIPDFTFWATLEAVVNVGANPIPVDVDAETFHWSVELITEAIEKFKPKAAILVHLFGWACPVTFEIRELCKKKGVLLLEDSAQAFGTTLSGKSVIGTAEVASTSFYPAKVLGACGDAGALFFANATLAKKAVSLVNHGRAEHYSYSDVGWNSRMGAYEASFLIRSLGHLEARIQSRKEILKLYREHLNLPGLKIHSPAQSVTENGYLCVATVENERRAAFIDYLKSKKIGYSIVYPETMSEQKGAQAYVKDALTVGNALKLTRSVINLPCFPYMTQEEIFYVIQNVKEFFKPTN